MARTVNKEKLSERIKPSKKGWAVRVMIAGKRETFWARTKTECKQDVLAAVDRAENPQRGGDDAPRNYDEACDKLLNVYTKRDSSKATLESNLNASRKRFGPTPLDQITRYQGQVWLLELDGQGLAAHTMDNYLKDGKRVLENAVENDWLDKNRWRTLRVDDVIDQPDPFDSWDEIFRIASCFAWKPFDRATRFGAGQALRPQEFLVSRECDVDRKNGIYTISRTWDDELRQEVEAGKTRGSLGTFALAEIGSEVLDEIPPSLHRDPADWRNSPLLFPGPNGELVDPNRFRTFWKEAVELSGVRYRPPKQLRHSFATLTLLALGLEHMKDVSVMMRHDHVRTTERYYLKIVQEMLVKAAGKVSTGMPSYQDFLHTGADQAAAS